MGDECFGWLGHGDWLGRSSTEDGRPVEGKDRGFLQGGMW